MDGNEAHLSTDMHTWNLSKERRDPDLPTILFDTVRGWSELSIYDVMDSTL